MDTQYLMMSFFGLLFVLILFLLWLGPRLGQRRQENQLEALARMQRCARRHNTFVRNANGVRFVVILGMNGFHYMLDGQWVSRSRVVRSIGEADERLLFKAEGEESRQGPVPTISLTRPA